MPPAPSGATTSYTPRRVPELRGIRGSRIIATSYEPKRLISGGPAGLAGVVDFAPGAGLAGPVAVSICPRLISAAGALPRAFRFKSSTFQPPRHPSSVLHSP